MEKIFIATIGKVTKDKVVKSYSNREVGCILEDGKYINIESDEPEVLCYLNQDLGNVDENKVYMISVKEYPETNLTDKFYLKLIKQALKTRQKLETIKSYSKAKII